MTSEGELIDQKLIGFNYLGEEEIEGVHLIFDRDAIYVYIHEGKLKVLINGKPVQRSD